MDSGTIAQRDVGFGGDGGHASTLAATVPEHTRASTQDHADLYVPSAGPQRLDDLDSHARTVGFWQFTHDDQPMGQYP
jgi:hypothetical protein